MENGKKYKAVLWDFDGTVTDTNRIILDSFQATFRYATGNERKPEEIVSTFGEPLYDTMKNFFGDRVEECLEYYRDYQSKLYFEKLKLCDGVLDVIKELQKRGYKQAIVTSRYKPSCMEAMEFLHIVPYFDTIITCDDCAKHKPDPEPALLALKALGVKPSDAILIGDSKHDMGCGRNAGVTTVLIGWSIACGPLNLSLDRAALEKLIDLRIETPKDLLTLLK